MRKLKGGSIASDSVTTMVNETTYDNMNKAADNLVDGGMCGGANGKRTKPKAAKKVGTSCNCGRKIKFGGNGQSILDRVFDGFAMNFSEQFVDRAQTISSLPAPAVGGKKPKKGGSLVKKGGEFKNMSEYMSSTPDKYGKVNVYNKKVGGSKSNVGLDYNSGIKTNDFKGTNVGRNVSTAVLEVLSNASVTNASVSSMNKAVQYGNYANASLRTPFNYGGVEGGAKKTKPKAKAPKKQKTPKK